MQPPVFGSPNVTSGHTTPMWAGAGSRSQILGRGHPQRGLTLVRSLVVSQVGNFQFLIGSIVSEDDILSGLILEDGCDCTSETTEGY